MCQLFQNAIWGCGHASRGYTFYCETAKQQGRPCSEIFTGAEEATWWDKRKCARQYSQDGTVPGCFEIWRAPLTASWARNRAAAVREAVGRGRFRINEWAAAWDQVRATLWDKYVNMERQFPPLYDCYETAQAHVEARMLRSARSAGNQVPRHDHEARHVLRLVIEQAILEMRRQRDDLYARFAATEEEEFLHQAARTEEYLAGMMLRREELDE